MIHNNSNGWTVEVTQDKGKVVRATKNFNPGEVVFQEEPIVSASWHKFRCSFCGKPHQFVDCEEAAKFYPPNAFQKQSDLEDLLVERAGMDELDKARLFLYLMNALYLHQHVEQSDYVNDYLKEITQMINSVKEYSKVNLPKAASCVKTVFQIVVELEIEYADAWFNTEENKQKLSEILSLINTNALTLEAFSGLGLFKNACRFEHSCVPNCNFSSHYFREENRNLLTITAIKPISVGQNMSIDYIEAFYQPYEERKAILLNNYGFLCKCPACTGIIPDYARSFACPNDEKLEDEEEKLMEAAQNVKRKYESDAVKENVHRIVPPLWKCLACGHQLEDYEIKEFEQAEADLEDTFPETIDEVIEILSEHIFKKEHHLIFESLDSIAHEMANEDATDEEFQSSGIHMLFQLLVECIEIVCENPFSHNKINVYDELAQIYVKLGDTENAKFWFTRAFEMSKICIGPSSICPITKELEDLSTNTPTQAAELLKRYSNMMDVEDQLHYQGDDEAIDAFRNLTISRGFNEDDDEEEEDDGDDDDDDEDFEELDSNEDEEEDDAEVDENGSEGKEN